MLSMLRETYGEPEQSRVIYNGRNSSRFRPAKKREYVFAAGRIWDEAKNISTLASAGALVSWQVYIAGDRNSPDGQQAPRENVEYLGCLSPVDLARWYAHCSIYALPVKYEPFGLSIVEAALCECALVLGDISSMRELWQDCALFVDPEDDVALAAAINELAHNHAKRVRLGRNARIRAQQFSVERMANQYHELYSSLVSPRILGRVEAVRPPETYPPVLRAARAEEGLA
jgi:glycosyltransferase involved in cell wall biosynthesis